MSKRRHKDRGRNMNNQNLNYSWRNNMRGPMNNPFGITPQQLLSMFGGNIDMNRINNILSSMNREGYDINGLHEEMKSHNFNNSSASNENNIPNEMPKEHNSNDFEASDNLNKKDIKNLLEKAKIKKIDEDNMKFLINLKEIVDTKKQVFIDNIIDILLK